MKKYTKILKTICALILLTAIIFGLKNSTLGWKTYTSTKPNFSFTFKYPNSLGDPDVYDDPTYSVNNNIVSFKNYAFEIVDESNFKWDNGYVPTVAELLEYYPKTKIDIYGDVKDYGISKYSLAGINVVRVKVFGQNNAYSTDVYLFKGNTEKTNKYYRIQSNESQVTDSTLTKILSTFKFND